MTWHIKNVYRNEGGLKGFYRGTVPTVVRATQLNAAYLGSYDSSKNAIKDRGWMKDGHSLRFVSSVIAGFCVSLSTAPMDNIKTRVMNAKPGESSTILGQCRILMKERGGMINFFRGFGPMWCRFAPYVLI